MFQGLNRTMDWRIEHHPAGQRGHGTAGLSVAAALMLVGALSSCGSALTSTSTSTRTTNPRAAAVDTPTIASGLPARSTVISASVEGTNGWVLTRGDEAGIWLVPASGESHRVVPEATYKNLLASGVSIVAFNGGVVLLGQRCDSDVTVMPECLRSTGVVEFFGEDGKAAPITTLWNNEAIQAGGTPPVLLEAEPSKLWLDGIDHAYAVGTTGDVIETVPRMGSTNLCAIAGDLYALDWNGAGMPDKSEAGSPEPLALWKWSGKRWVPRADAHAPDVAGLPSYSCGTEGIMLWTGFTLTAHWSPSEGWKDLTRSSAPIPTARSDIGVGYTVSATGSLERLDPETGTTVDLGLELGASHDASRPPNGLAVAERGRSVFACTYAYNGTSGEAPVPPTVCGFTTTSG